MKQIIFIVIAFVNVVACAHPDSTASAQTAQIPLSESLLAEFEKQSALVQDDLSKMQAQASRLQQSHDLRTRQRLLHEHWTTIQHAMRIMHDMWGNGLLGCCDGAGQTSHSRGVPSKVDRKPGWSNAESHYSNLTPEQLRQRQYMADQYLMLQQQMINHMMLHQHAVTKVPPAKK